MCNYVLALEALQHTLAWYERFNWRMSQYWVCIVQDVVICVGIYPWVNMCVIAYMQVLHCVKRHRNKTFLQTLATTSASFDSWPKLVFPIFVLLLILTDAPMMMKTWASDCLNSTSSYSSFLSSPNTSERERGMLIFSAGNTTKVSYEN